jgi:hypothetical protein
MGDEILEFVKVTGATDLRTAPNYLEVHRFLKRPNYFLLGNDKFLIIKISRNKIRPFFGLGKPVFDQFNKLTDGRGGIFFFVGLISSKEGWVLSKKELINQIFNGSISYSPNQDQYKINNYNLKDQHAFSCIEGFFKIIDNIMPIPRTSGHLSHDYPAAHSTVIRPVAGIKNFRGSEGRATLTY